MPVSKNPTTIVDTTPIGASAPVVQNSTPAPIVTPPTETPPVNPNTTVYATYVTNQFTTVANINNPGGNTGELQFNNGGSFAGDEDLTYNPVTNDLNVNGLITADVVKAGSFVLNSGSLLQPYSNINVAAYLATPNNILLTGANSLKIMGGISGQVLTTYGNGTLYWSTPGSSANANYAAFAGIAYSVSGANVSGIVANANYAAFSGVAASANSVAGSGVVGAVANATHAISAVTATSATVAASANSVALANVSGAGNIASINLNGNGSQVLAGNGAWVTQSGGNGTANTGNITFDGDYIGSTNNIVVVTASDYAQLESGTNYVWVDSSGVHFESGETRWDLDSSGNISLPSGGVIDGSTSGHIKLTPDKNVTDYGLDIYISYDNDTHIAPVNTAKGVALGTSYNSGPHVRVVGSDGYGSYTDGQVVVHAQDISGNNQSSEYVFTTDGDIVNTAGDSYLGIGLVEDLSPTKVNKTLQILGRSGMTTIFGPGSTDDTAIEVVLPWPVRAGGQEFTSIWISSNSLIVYGYNPGSWIPNGGNQYDEAIAELSGHPFIMIDGADNSYQYVFTATENGGSTFRIRWEGTNQTSGTPNASNMIWEAVFYRDDQTRVDVNINTNARNGGGTTLTSNGSVLVDTFNPAATNAYTFRIPGTAQVRNLQFTGNNVSWSLSGDTAQITVESGGGNPFDQSLNVEDDVTFNNIESTAKIIAAQSEGTVGGGFSFSGNEGGRDSGMFSETDGVVDFYANDQKIVTVTTESVEFNRNITSNGLEIYTNSGSNGSIDIYTDWTGSGTSGGLDLWLVHGDGVYVKTDDGNYVWKFDNAGNLVLPGNTFSVNYANGTQVQLGGGGNGTPGGSDGQIQFNDEGSFGGDSGLTYDSVTGTMTVDQVHDTSDRRITNTYDGNGTLLVGSNMTQTPVSILMGGAGPRNEWKFTPDGLTTFPGGAIIDSADSNFEVRGVNNVNLEAQSDINLSTGDGNNLWKFDGDGGLQLPGGVYDPNSPASIKNNYGFVLHPPHNTGGTGPELSIAYNDGIEISPVTNDYYAGGDTAAPFYISGTSLNVAGKNPGPVIIQGGRNFATGAYAGISVVTNNKTWSFAPSGTLSAPGDITAQGNVTADNIGNVAALDLNGNGSQVLAGNGAWVTVDTANANYANYAGEVVSSAQPNITSVGTLSDLIVGGDATVTGNLNVSGNLTYIDVTNLRIQDPVIQMGGGANGANLTTNDGRDRGTYLHVYDTGRGAEVDKFMGWDNSNAEFAFGSNVTLSNDVVTFNSFGNIRAGNFIGEVVGNVSGSAGSANSVALANVTGVGNIAELNLNGNASQVLAGNGAWVNNNPFDQVLNTASDVSFESVTSNAIIIPSIGDSEVGILTSDLRGRLYFDSDSAFHIVTDDTWATTFQANGTVTFGGGYTFPAVAGTEGQVLVTNGSGILSWQDQSTGNVGNIAAINLDGNVSNVLAGDGTWVPQASGGTSLPYLELTSTGFIGDAVVFTKTNYGTEVDNIDTDVAITRGNNQGIYNPLVEGGWDSGVSPANTEWNADGWDDLTNVTSRTYTNFYDAVGGNLGNNILGLKLVMHDTVNDNYYTFIFSSWTAGGGGGGIIYTRHQIDVASPQAGITFADGTVQTTAYTGDTTKTWTNPNDNVWKIVEYSGGAAVQYTYGNTTHTTNATETQVDPGTLVLNGNTDTNVVTIMNILTSVTYNGITYVYSGYTQLTPGVYTVSFNTPFPSYTPGDNVTLNYPNTAQPPVPVVWWDAANSPGGAGNFRGAIIEYHAYSDDCGTVIGTIHVAFDDEQTATHTEVTSGANDTAQLVLWDRSGDNAQVLFRRTDVETDTLFIQWTSKIFYGSERYC